MGIFSKKPAFAFSEILKGLQQAVNSATSMLQAQQMDNLSHFWMKDGRLVTKKVQIGDRELEVPMLKKSHCVKKQMSTRSQIGWRNPKSHIE